MQKVIAVTATQDERDNASEISLIRIMDIVRNLGINEIDNQRIIEEIVQIQFMHRWSGWYAGYSAGRASKTV